MNATNKAPKINQRKAYEMGERDLAAGYFDNGNYYERNYNAGIYLAYMDGLQGFRFHTRSADGLTARK